MICLGGARRVLNNNEAVRHKDSIIGVSLLGAKWTIVCVDYAEASSFRKILTDRKDRFAARPGLLEYCNNSGVGGWQQEASV